MIPVPVTFLLHGRLPDRDIFRTLALAGPLTQGQLRERLHVTPSVLYSALDRLARQRIVTWRRLPRPGQATGLLEWTATGVPS